MSTNNAFAISLKLAEPLEDRDQDRQRCQQLFEAHCAQRGLSVRHGQEFGSYVSGKTQAAWMAWCAAIGLPSYLNPQLSDVDWWIACVEKVSPISMYLKPGVRPLDSRYVELGNTGVWVMKEHAWMLSHEARQSIEGQDTMSASVRATGR
ncbi:hypothetical protein V4C53_18010 [Paraburkholderia azotifigens]|uniref:hypothetical protein n=1 Tax=Paraburkholderia azotifigens TaxID=2057004 RepID=UPI00317746C1